MKTLLTTLVLVVASGSSFACTLCRLSVREKIYDSTFYPNLFIMLSAFILLGIITAILSYFSTRRYRKWPPDGSGNLYPNPVPLTTAAIILGIGLGSFVDGITFHQILQWHEMLSNKIPPVTVDAKTINMFWDGIFHTFAFIVVFTGIILLWKTLFRTNVQRSGKLLAGGMLVGWGMLNIIDGVINHHILKLHNLREITDNREAWNYGYLGVSILLLLIGFWLIRRARPESIWKVRPIKKVPGTESIE